MKSTIFILVIIFFFPQFKAQCDSNPSYCKNEGICGVNGFCICQSFYYGDRCENKDPESEQAVLFSDGTNSGLLFFYCFLIMIPLPFCLYLCIAICIKLCTDELYERTCGETVSDAFCCNGKFCNDDDSDCDCC
ncbi:UNKNOWN [Stylonychia lemnae]|uniref:EGF-like domain-containing protein n=1 Tax=Stylonychia lemnae TaxID=5949 RepID=A0A078ASL7_STYLE|nr:UNKNOWN [Stylonychia lemnae]|eukprot:CDW84981.1 UNKNOWN [Stylonychia lemnae]